MDQNLRSNFYDPRFEDLVSKFYGTAVAPDISIHFINELRNLYSHDENLRSNYFF